MRNGQTQPSSRPRGRMDSTRPTRHAVHVSGSGAKRLGDAIKAVRGAMRLSQDEFARRGNLGRSSVQRVEDGEMSRPRAQTLNGLDKAAGWPDGTALAVFEGRQRPPGPHGNPTANGLSRTPERYNDPATDSIDEKAILRRMIELIPSIRRRYGNEQADLMVGRIMTLASQSNLAEWASAYLQEYAAR